jgi:Na+/proline symporter
MNDELKNGIKGMYFRTVAIISIAIIWYSFIAPALSKINNDVMMGIAVIGSIFIVPPALFDLVWRWIKRFNQLTESKDN